MQSDICRGGTASCLMPLGAKVIWTLLIKAKKISSKMRSHLSALDLKCWLSKKIDIYKTIQQDFCRAGTLHMQPMRDCKTQGDQCRQSIDYERIDPALGVGVKRRLSRYSNRFPTGGIYISGLKTVSNYQSCEFNKYKYNQ